MAAEHRELVPHHFRITADVARIDQPSDRTQRKLLATAGDHHRRTWLLNWLRLEDRVLDMEYLPWNVVRFSVHIARMSRTASSICRMRTAGRAGNSQPY
jgi:hypothetical protein